MEIQLQPPFNTRWNKGYKVFDNSTGRYRVVFYNSKEDISGMSFARYLYSIFLGYEVPTEYEVDHINNDKTDDRIENLQLLTQEQNIEKQNWNYVALVQQWYIVPCDHCNGLFFITQRDLNSRIAKGVEHLFCSRPCAAYFHHKLKNNIDIELIKQLKYEGLSSYKISEKTGYSRTTILKYW